MGVGRENKDVFFTPYVPENEMQILESQSSGQSTDEEDVNSSSHARNHRHASHRRGARARPRSASLEACLTGMYRRCGAKQARRTENIKHLLNLPGVEEEGAGCRAPGYNSSTSAFAVVLQEREKMQAWNNFVNSSEEDQQRILQMRRSDAALSSIQEEDSDVGEDENGNLDDSWEKVSSPSHDRRAVHPSFSSEQCFERVEKHLRSMLTRRHLPLGMVAQLEKEVVEFFSDFPGSVYVSHLSSSFERMLLHAVCQYLGLHCRSYDEGGERRTQVENQQQSFSFPSETLAEFLERTS